MKSHDGRTEEFSYENLIMEPKVEQDALVDQTGNVNFRTLESDSGAFILGNCLKSSFPLMNNREIERQADVIAANLLGQAQTYEYSPEVWVRTGVNSSIKLTLDAKGRVRFHQEYSGFNFHLNDLTQEVANKTKAFIRDAWY